MNKKSKIGRSYGWKPGLPDVRDRKYSIEKPIVIPESVDLRPTCSPVEDQGSIGSCTANSLVGNLEFLENLNKQPFVDLSRLFIYFNERDLEGSTDSDSGAEIRDGIKTLATNGVCPEIDWPYDKDITIKPIDQCYAEALKHTISSYTSISSLNDMLHCLSDGFPFVFGFTVYDYFESTEISQTGILKIPTSDESTIGGHAVMACGFNQTTKMMLVRNSWGSGWGINGYFWMPFDYISNVNLATDFWTIRKEN
jgi:C1A family cysteine protease